MFCENGRHGNRRGVFERRALIGQVRRCRLCAWRSSKRGFPGVVNFDKGEGELGLAFVVACNNFCLFVVRISVRCTDVGRYVSFGVRPFISGLCRVRRSVSGEGCCTGGVALKRRGGEN